MKKVLIILIMSVTSISASAGDNYKGRITGIVLDKSTQQPLAGSNVVVMGTKLGDAADLEGEFEINNIPVGTYQLKAMMIGYQTMVKTDVVVSTGHKVHIVIELQPMVLKGEEITVQADYFHKDYEANTSIQTFDYEEIRRAPGGVEDINRVMMSMPGVASTTDQINNLVVRGGDPIENLTLVDNIELPNSNHFGDQGSTGGPIGMINTDFIREANFYTGGFPAKYGDKLSSVLDIRLREGNREHFAGDVNLSMAGVGGVFEGPLLTKNGSWMISYRKSYLDLILGPIGLTAVPYYQDLQVKITYDLSPNNKLSFVGIGGIDKIHIETDEDAYSQGDDDVLSKTDQYAVGVNWKSLWSKKGYSILTLSHVANNFTIDVKEVDSTLAASPVFLNKSWEKETVLRGEVNYNFNPENRLSFGFKYKDINFKHNIWSKDYKWHPTFEDSAGIPHRDTTQMVIIKGQRLDKKFNTSKAALFANYNWKLLNGLLNINAGLRYDYFDYTNVSILKPRLGVSYFLTAKTQLNASFGFYSQAAPYIWLTQHPENKKLKNMRNQQLVLGIEHLFRDDLKFTVEVYNKDYSDYPVEKTDTTRILVNDGKGYSRGVDIFLQKKLFDNYYGLISYSYYVAQAKKPKLGWFDWDYDYRHVFTFIGGYKIRLDGKEWYNKMKKKLWFKIFAGLHPFADEMEFSVKWRYMGGRPYTPIASIDYLENGDEWQANYRDEDTNSARFPAYHRLDIRFDRRFHFKGWNLVTYFEIENVYNRGNIWGYQWNRRKGKNEKVYQFKFFPVGGFSVEF